MADPARHEEVVDMVQYLEDTIAAIDAGVHEWLANRTDLAVRLTAMKAATDPKVIAAAADYEARIGEGRPYEGAEDTESLIVEARRRFVP